MHRIQTRKLVFVLTNYNTCSNVRIAAGVSVVVYARNTISLLTVSRPEVNPFEYSVSWLLIHGDYVPRPNECSYIFT
jgi:hypothetical protein